MLNQLFNASYIAMTLGFFRKVLQRLVPGGPGRKYIVAMGIYGRFEPHPVLLVLSIHDSIEDARVAARKFHPNHRYEPTFNISIVLYPDWRMVDLISTDEHGGVAYNEAVSVNNSNLLKADKISIFNKKAIQLTHIVESIYYMQMQRSTEMGQTAEHHRKHGWLIV
jgi:hypothetical protein